MTLAELLQEQGQPGQAFEVLEPLLDAVVNEELWLCAMQCQSEPAPRGLGDRGRLMDLYARYQAHLRTVALPGPTDRAELAYKSLLMATGARESFEAAEHRDTSPSGSVPTVGPLNSNGNGSHRRSGLASKEGVR